MPHSQDEAPHMSLLDINVQVDTESDLDLQDMVDNAEEVSS
jgi:hypothetical protein